MTDKVDTENETPAFGKAVLGVVPTTKALSIVGSSRNNGDREAEDFYPTPPYAVEELLKREVFSGNIWECACGEGHLSKIFTDAGYNVKSTDLMDRGFGENGIDFLSIDNLQWNGDVITNPPYKYAQGFCEKALQIIPDGMKVAMFLKVLLLVKLKELQEQFCEDIKMH